MDPKFNADERRGIGRAIIEHIQLRTEKGHGVGNRPFRNKEGKREYSERYQDSREFAIGGKSKGPINLSLTGDMLVSLEVLDISLAGRIVIGIDDPENEDKARWMREKGYHFMGISDAEKELILARFSKLTPNQVRASNLSEEIAEQLLRELLDG